jgi:4-alpha-glucanotransferase
LPIDELFDDDEFSDRLLAVDRARRAATASVPPAAPPIASSEPDTP